MYGQNLNKFKDNIVYMRARKVKQSIATFFFLILLLF